MPKPQIRTRHSSPCLKGRGLLARCDDKKLITIAHDWACRAIQHYIYDNLDDPWTLAKAYEIALSCPDIQLKECDVNQGRPRTWTITTPYRPDVQAEGTKELYHKLRTAKEYCLTLKKKELPKKHRSTRDITCEAYEIAGTCPAMFVEDLRHGGWFRRAVFHQGEAEKEHCAIREEAVSNFLDEHFESTWGFLEDTLGDLKRIFEGTKRERMDDAKIKQLYKIAEEARQFQGARLGIERSLQSGETPTDEQIGAVRICEQHLFRELERFAKMEGEEKQ